MKKTNNKFRSNNNNTSIYSLNYKFDSVCFAGKYSGTALDLIKKYNELAKEAHSRGDYVDMEIFRQYAEHYRKIVTEINARKNQNRENMQQNQDAQTENQPSDAAENSAAPVDNGLVETEAAPQPSDNANTSADEKPTRRRVGKRAFTVVEITERATAQEPGANENTNKEDPQSASDDAQKSPKSRAPRKRVLKKTAE